MKNLIAIVLLMMLVGLAQAQITITQEDAPDVGTRNTSFSGNSEVNWAPGSGGSQNWDISSFAFTEESTSEYVAASGTPYAASFPTATHCVVSTENSYTYYRIASDGLYFEGYAVPTDSVPFIQRPEAEARILPFPCSNGTTWTTVMRFTTEFMPGFVTTSIDSSIYTVDGWGTMTTPRWTAGALRLYNHSWFSTFFNGMPIGDVIEDWSYAFATENPARSASYFSTNATGPGFTTGIVGYTAEGGVAVGPVRPVTEDFKLSQNYPNPFNPTTNLPIELAKNLHVEMTIYNETGQVVLQQSLDLSAGSHNLPIDGSAWGSGSYFAKVMAGGEVQSARMVLVK